MMEDVRGEKMEDVRAHVFCTGGGGNHARHSLLVDGTTVAG